MTMKTIDIWINIYIGRTPSPKFHPFITFTYGIPIESTKTSTNRKSSILRIRYSIDTQRQTYTYIFVLFFSFILHPFIVGKLTLSAQMCYQSTWFSVYWFWFWFWFWFCVSHFIFKFRNRLIDRIM